MTAQPKEPKEKKVSIARIESRLTELFKKNPVSLNDDLADELKLEQADLKSICHQVCLDELVAETVRKNYLEKIKANFSKQDKKSNAYKIISKNLGNNISFQRLLCVLQINIDGLSASVRLCINEIRQDMGQLLAKKAAQLPEEFRQQTDTYISCMAKLQLETVERLRLEIELSVMVALEKNLGNKNEVDLDATLKAANWSWQSLLKERLHLTDKDEQKSIFSDLEQYTEQLLKEKLMQYQFSEGGIAGNKDASEQLKRDALQLKKEYEKSFHGNYDIFPMNKMPNTSPLPDKIIYVGYSDSADYITYFVKTPDGKKGGDFICLNELGLDSKNMQPFHSNGLNALTSKLDKMIEITSKKGHTNKEDPEQLKLPEQIENAKDRRLEIADKIKSTRRRMQILLEDEKLGDQNEEKVEEQKEQSIETQEMFNVIKAIEAIESQFKLKFSPTITSGANQLINILTANVTQEIVADYNHSMRKNFTPNQVRNVIKGRLNGSLSQYHIVAQDKDRARRDGKVDSILKIELAGSFFTDPKHKPKQERLIQYFRTRNKEEFFKNADADADAAASTELSNTSLSFDLKRQPDLPSFWSHAKGYVVDKVVGKIENIKKSTANNPTKTTVGGVSTAATVATVLASYFETGGADNYLTQGISGKVPGLESWHMMLAGAALLMLGAYFLDRYLQSNSDKSRVPAVEENRSPLLK